MKRFRMWAVAAASGVLFCGCGVQAEQKSVNTPYVAVSGMEDTPVVDYTIPRSLPNVLVDTRGYVAECEKRAAVKGHGLPETFSLMDAVTGNEVYSGPLEKITYNEESGLYTGFACFDDYTVEGSYYLECDIIGRSYTFQIRESIYGDLFQECYESVVESCRERTLSISDAMDLLVVYEWYGDVFPDTDKDQVPDVMKELQSWISFMEESEIAPEDVALYAAFLAKFGYNYQKFDEQYATDALRRASTVFGQVQTTLGRDADDFLALTELYRATGLSTYRRQISDYEGFFENNGSYLEEKSYLYGAMTYMSTRQKVDVGLCQIFMNHIMDHGEEISKRYEDMIHPVTARNNGADDLLKSAMKLSCANYVLNSYQYMKITEEFLHYLMGQNAESVCFYPEEGDRSIYLLLFAQLKEMHEVG